MSGTTDLQYFLSSDNKLSATFSFSDFTVAFGFMAQVAIKAEKINHHPTWTNTYNQVEIVLTTHDANNTITEKDFKLANMIEAIYNQMKS